MRRSDKIAKEQYQAKLELIKSGANFNPNESKQEQNARIDCAKKNFAYFVEIYLLHYITDDETGEIIKSPDFHISFANKVKREKRIKALMRWARAHAKSVVADLFIPLWLWINDDTKYVVLIGNNEDKAKILLSDLQAEFEANQLLIHDFGEQHKSGNWEKGYFITKNGFIAKAIGMGQDVRGLRMKSRRPDYIVADDLEDKDTLKNPKRQDEVAKWLLTAVIPTMDGKRSRFIVANNLFAPRMIQTVLEETTEGWYINQINAYDPVTYEPTWKAKYTAEYWKEIEKELGTINANAEYNNKPHIEGKIFKEDQIQWAKRPRLNQFTTIVGHWDVAYAGRKTSDYNAVRVWGLYKKDFWYLDSFVRQTKMKDAVIWMCLFQLSLPKTVLVKWRFESQFWNDEVERTIREVEDSFGIKLNIVKVQVAKVKKYERILKLQTYYQNSRIYYDIDKKAHSDTQTGLQQLYGIEPGYKTHDDAPDADEQAIGYLETYIRTSRFKPRTGKMKKNKKRTWR
ncbi:MAG: hypothetical protein L3J56_10835 [Bacteroidales bacterium]|nr:hypothetical protein [Bacteroidales bacterium]